MLAGCGGSSGGGSDSVAFPTPTLPAGAARFDATNATASASSAVEFAQTLSFASALKSDEPPGPAEALAAILLRIETRYRGSLNAAARIEDISAGLCVTGSAIADFDETDTSATGNIAFSVCDLGGVFLSGNLGYDTSWNNTTLDYLFAAGGTLTISAAGEVITVVLNLDESGNDGTGAYSVTGSFSLDGIPGGGFLVTTSQPLVGNAFTLEVTGGQLIAFGSDNTRIQITVTGPNAADVDLDTGTGTFVPHDTIVF